MSARAAGVLLLVLALLGFLAVVVLALVHGSVEPVLLVTAGLGLVASAAVVLVDHRRVPRI